MVWKNRAALNFKLYSKVLRHSQYLYLPLQSTFQTHKFTYAFSPFLFVDPSFGRILSYISYQLLKVRCACVYSEFLCMSNRSHARPIPTADPYLVKSLFILPIPLVASLFTAFTFSVWRGFFFLNLSSCCKSRADPLPFTSWIF